MARVRRGRRAFAVFHFALGLVCTVDDARVADAAPVVCFACGRR